MVTARSDNAIHRVIHGYRGGHRLVASSTELDAASTSLMARLSDSAPNYKASEGPYLTGYRLPDDRYVFARTRPAGPDDRPNTVVTHSLIIPARRVTHSRSSAFVAILDDWSSQPISDVLDPVELQGVEAQPAVLPFETALQASAYYLSPSTVIHERDRERREVIALALWDQLWSPARSSLAFCTALDATRFAEQPASLRFTRSGPVLHPAISSTSWDVVVDDLAGVSDGQFRAFVHFVGSGTRRLSLMAALAEAWFLLSREEGAAAADLEQFLFDIAPQPNNLRRLKRRALSFDHGAPRWSAPPDAVMRALATGPLGEMVLEEDASLAEWLAAAWRRNPESVLLLVGTAQIDPSERAPKRTAREGLSSAFNSGLVELLTPGTLVLAAQAHPKPTMAALFARNDLTLWAAFGSLDTDTASRLLKAATAPREFDWTRCFEALSSASVAEGLLADSDERAIEALVNRMAKSPNPSDWSIELSSGMAHRYVRGQLERTTDPRQLRALCALADAEDVPRRLDIRTLTAALADAPEHVAPIAYLASREVDADDAATVAGASFAHLYDLLAAGMGHREWNWITDRVRGDRHDWDRCSRLTRDYADHLARRRPEVAEKGLVAVRRRSQRAARALEAEAERRSKKREGWRLSDLFRW
jgi:GTPase-associated protein 1, N-terminal domain type 1